MATIPSEVSLGDRIKGAVRNQDRLVLGGSLPTGTAKSGWVFKQDDPVTKTEQKVPDGLIPHCSPAEIKVCHGL